MDLDREIDGIRIPSGYRRLPDDADVDRELLDTIRIFNGRVRFVHEPDEKFQAELDKCKEDTRELNKSLHRKLRQMNLPFVVDGRKISGYQKEFKVVGFLIRPPLLEKITGDTRDRMQANSASSFILHFDSAGKLHVVRHLVTPGQDETFEKEVKRQLLQRQASLEKSYGNWDLFADQIAQALERVKKTQPRPRLEQQS